VVGRTLNGGGREREEEKGKEEKKKFKKHKGPPSPPGRGTFLTGICLIEYFSYLIEMQYRSVSASINSNIAFGVIINCWLFLKLEEFPKRNQILLGGAPF